MATPVWIAAAGKHYYVFSEGQAGKVKRIRGNSRVRVAPCNFKGDIRGDWLDGDAALINDPTTIALAYTALHQKYGWQMRISDFFSKLSGRYARRAMIELTLQEETGTKTDGEERTTL